MCVLGAGGGGKGEGGRTQVSLLDQNIKTSALILIHAQITNMSDLWTPTTIRQIHRSWWDMFAQLENE